MGEAQTGWVGEGRAALTYTLRIAGRALAAPVVVLFSASSFAAVAAGAERVLQEMPEADRVEVTVDGQPVALIER